MNKPIIFISCVVFFVLVDFGLSTKAQVDELKNENAQLQSNNFDLKKTIEYKESLAKRTPVLIATAYSAVINQIKLLESYSGTSMNVQLDGAKDTEDITSNYVDTEYKGIRGLKIQIVVDKFSQETDMGAVLDDIYTLEENTDFIASEISKENNNIIVKGEVYGL